jgi:hypothetical protein
MIEHIPIYTNSDLEVEETSRASIEYILGGDPINSVYDLSGLLVFGVIKALREHDDLLYGPNASLTPEEITRLAEIEDAVDLAVEGGMHYYPFGDYQNKKNIAQSTMAQLAGLDRGLPKPRKSTSNDRWERRERAEAAKKPQPNGPLIIKPVEE